VKKDLTYSLISPQNVLLGKTLIIQKKIGSTQQGIFSLLKQHIAMIKKITYIRSRQKISLMIETTLCLIITHSKKV